MADKLMYIPNVLIHKITLSVDYIWWLKRLDTQLNNKQSKSILSPQSC